MEPVVGRDVRRPSILPRRLKALMLAGCVGGLLAGCGSTGRGASVTCASGLSPVLGAFDVDSGAHVWSYCSADEAWREVVSATGAVVYMVSQSQQGAVELTAVDARRGTEIWRQSVKHAQTPPGPFAGGGVVVVMAADTDALVGLDASTGDRKWERTSAESTVVGNTEDVVVIATGMGSGPGGLRGLDRATGEDRWSNDVQPQNTSGIVASRGVSAVTSDTLIVPTGQSLVALDAKTGAQRWEGALVDHPSAGDGAIVGRTPARGSENDTLQALDAATGVTRWTGSGRPAYGELWALGDGAVYVLDNRGGVVAYDLDNGAERWHISGTDRKMMEPQIVSGKTLVTMWEADLGARSTTDGASRWWKTRPLESDMMSSVRTSGGLVYVSVNTLPWGD